MQATNKKGAPTQQSADSFASQMKASRVAPHAWQSLKTGGNMAETLAINSTSYPERPLPLDDRDSDVAMLNDLAHASQDAAGGNVVPAMISSARPYPIQDWELNYMKSKAAAEDYAAYQQWLGNKYNLNDMATRAWFKQIAPEYFTKKRELLKELMDRHAKYSYLRMAGPENEEDLRFEYAVETGRIPIPKGPFYNPMEWLMNDVPDARGKANDAVGVAAFITEVQKFNRVGYEYGLFNPVKPRTATQAGFPGSKENPQDIVGATDKNSYGFAGQTPPADYSWSNAYGGSTLFNNRNTRGEIAITNQQRATTDLRGYTPAISNATGQMESGYGYHPVGHGYQNANVIQNNAGNANYNPAQLGNVASPNYGYPNNRRWF